MEIHFPHGLPGFEDCSRFILQPVAAGSWLLRMISTEKADLQIFLTPYLPDVMPMPYSDLVEVGMTWGIENDKLAVAFVTIIKRAEANEQLRMIANFGAPILIDVGQGRAVQHIMPLGRYSYHQQVWPC